MGTFGKFDPITLNCQGHVTNHSEAAENYVMSCHCWLAEWRHKSMPFTSLSLVNVLSYDSKSKQTVKNILIIHEYLYLSEIFIETWILI